MKEKPYKCLGQGNPNGSFGEFINFKGHISSPIIPRPHFLTDTEYKVHKTMYHGQHLMTHQERTWRIPQNTGQMLSFQPNVNWHQHLTTLAVSCPTRGSLQPQLHCHCHSHFLQHLHTVPKSFHNNSGRDHLNNWIQLCLEKYPIHQCTNTLHKIAFFYFCQQEVRK